MTKRKTRDALTVLQVQAKQYVKDVVSCAEFPEDKADWEADQVSAFEAGWRAAVKWLTDATGKEE